MAGWDIYLNVYAVYNFSQIDLHQIAIPADAANYMALDNFEGDKDKKEIVFSVLAKLVTIELKVLLGQKRREKSYKLIIDSYNMTSAVNKRLVLEVCEVNQTCTRLDYQVRPLMLI